jgi:hypothetical protein
MFTLLKSDENSRLQRITTDDKVPDGVHVNIHILVYMSMYELSMQELDPSLRT